MTFEEYVLARGAALVRFARLLTGDDHRAEDLAQDVLANAYVSWWRVGRADQPDLYVRRMLLNAHHSWWRRRSNREVVTADLSDGRTTGDATTELAERDAMWRLVRALPARQRTVIVLRYYEDLSEAQTAEAMGCAVGTVKATVHQALRSLRQKLRVLV
jgi:RNA polymerase sigma-70 factor (sigma-E family)